MLIFATIAIDIAVIAIWSATYGVNGFKEVGKLIRGEASFATPRIPAFEKRNPFADRDSPISPLDPKRIDGPTVTDDTDDTGPGRTNPFGPDWEPRPKGIIR